MLDTSKYKYHIISKAEHKVLKKHDYVLKCQDGIDRMMMNLGSKGTCLVPYKVDDDLAEIVVPGKDYTDDELAEIIVNNMSFNKQKGS
jgi:hypothetical protein